MSTTASAVVPATTEAQGTSLPPKALQRTFWDRWNTHERMRGLDGYMARLKDVALSTLAPAGSGQQAILDAGCGTGWLADALQRSGARVTGVDFSPAAISFAQEHHPGVRFLDADLDDVRVESIYDAIVAADVLGHVGDQQGLIQRFAHWLRPGGKLLLMTHNPFVLSRASCTPAIQPGQIRNWPPLSELRTMLGPHFGIDSVRTIVPGGNMGCFRVIRHRYVFGVLRRTVGEDGIDPFYERLGMGREFIIHATRQG